MKKMDREIGEIRELCSAAQKLINTLYSYDPDNETFEQIGILNGKEIVLDYLEHGEVILALEHIFYMVYESEINYPKNQLDRLNSIAFEFGAKNNYEQKDT